MFTPIKNPLLLWAVIIAVTLGWAGLLYALSRVRARERKRLIIVTTFLGGLFYVLEFFLPAESRLFRVFFWRGVDTNPFTPLLPALGTAALAIGGFTVLLGVINLTIVHGRNILKRRAGSYNSAAFFIAMLAMIFFGLWQAYGKETTAFGRLSHRVYESLFQGAMVSLAATMFSLLAFYIAAAAYRAFRLRSGEATVLVAAAFIVMLGQVPVGMALTGSLPSQGWVSNLRVENLALWLSNVI
ncbi:MAG: hypothetical protein GTO55_01400, partial [Armatimonadetes bacterium]|nr:hypothetical protein [Armatimonadota bacterium]NIM22933.1 hypothetical protein [Armatimonadota bacterium]NIM66804.1 hypothetical protein [Armatimonadota bacterium]NIM75345.1 hypothetical protein [Armatimonadota bacterium]NIN04992.1 hypothetical protein [Armatimonadota bacterium]